MKSKQTHTSSDQLTSITNLQNNNQVIFCKRNRFHSTNIRNSNIFNQLSWKFSKLSSHNSATHRWMRKTNVDSGITSLRILAIELVISHFVPSLIWITSQSKCPSVFVRQSKLSFIYLSRSSVRGVFTHFCSLGNQSSISLHSLIGPIHQSSSLLTVSDYQFYRLHSMSTFIPHFSVFLSSLLSVGGSISLN
jgi:hypothetical protein